MSAKDTDRPKLQALLAEIRAGRVRSVVVTKVDRISRSLADLLDLMKLFEEHGVKFVSLRDSIDTSGPVGRFMLHILGAIAELERGITAGRVADEWTPVWVKRVLLEIELPHVRRHRLGRREGRLRRLAEEHGVARGNRFLGDAETRFWKVVAADIPHLREENSGPSTSA